ncbi:YbhB/YbcL family Raf kinase inhibitor-like protein [Paenibacillus cymbidii]|uniref:YbhB/YbcL family Raf kinase inhibitor-like protein n=1 Tax=Paenibacillus cymbidii TaxID=1639034 RepID=UPI001080E4F1|nr:YbhB/YbcL family Raf kinase inhibitor-like protein [Paenibacillus cymbidii]
MLAKAKRVGAAVLVSLGVLGAAANGYGAAPAETGASIPATNKPVAAFADVSGHWAEKTIDRWANKGLIDGYEEAAFRPDLPVSRGEWMALVNRSFGYGAAADVGFADLKAGDWAYEDVRKAVKAGYAEGYEDGTIRWNQPVNRQEAAVMLARLLRLDGAAEAVADYADAADVAAWSAGAVGAAARSGMMEGYEDGSYRPTRAITRAEAVVALDRAVLRHSPVYDEAGVYGPASGTASIIGNVTIAAGGVTLRNTVIAGDLLLAESIGDGDVLLDRVTVKGATTVQGGGANSVHLRDAVLVTVIVDKKTGDVRIVAEGGTSVQSVTVQSGARLETADEAGGAFGVVRLSERLPQGSQVTLAGTFDSVEISSAAVRVVVPQGTIRQLTTVEGAAGATLDLGEAATITRLVLEAALSVFGSGAIETAVVADGARQSTFAREPGKREDRSGAASPSPTASPSPSPSPAATTPGGSSGSNSPGPSEPAADTTAPTLSRTTTGTVSVGDNVYGQSNEAGTLYLVPKTAYTYEPHLTAMSQLPYGQRVTVSAGVYASINTAGLSAGTYVMYAKDSAGNLSAPSGDIRLEAAFALVSTAFSDGGAIGQTYSRGGGNMSVPLAWSNAPEGTRSFALLMYDTHPIAGNFIHWAVINIPGDATTLTASVAGDSLPGGSTPLGNNSNPNESGYIGPYPPASNDPAGGTHIYRFKLFALGNEQALVPDAFEAIIDGWMNGHVDSFAAAFGADLLAVAELSGTYFAQAAQLLTGATASAAEEADFATRIAYTPADGHSLRVSVSSFSFTGMQPELNAAPPEQTVPYTAGTPITGVLPGMHIGLYEVDGGNRVVKFADLALAEADVHTMRLESLGSTQSEVMLSFTPPGLSGLSEWTSFRVEYSADEGATWHEATIALPTDPPTVPAPVITSASNSATVYILSPDTSYQFRLVAELFGASGSSTVLVKRTLPSS